jgi:hypothetical protein
VLKRWWIWGLLLVCLACGREDAELAGVQNSGEPELRFATEEERQAARVVPHSYMVAFKDLSLDRKVFQQSFPAQLRAHGRSLTRQFAQYAGLRSMRFLGTLNLSQPGQSFAPRVTTYSSPWFHQELPYDHDMAGFSVVAFDNEEVAHATLRAWMQEGRIWFAEPNYRQDLKGEVEDRLIRDFQNNTTTPWLEQVGFVDAISSLANVPDKASPVIAVMDSGVDVEHPLLRDAVYRNELGQNKLCRGDIYGCNTTIAEKEQLGDGAVYPTGVEGFGQSCPFGSENCEHGTHVAGIIAANGSSDFTGLCPYCRILVVKVVEIEKRGNAEAFSIKDSSIIAGLAYVSGFKVGGEPLVRVINASFGKFERSRSVELFVRALRNFGRGTLMVAAAGNEDTMKRQYPAGFDEVIAVANVQSRVDTPSKSPSSNFGMWVDISAPGDGDCIVGSGAGILSTVPGGSADCKQGTSMAAPVVAGIAGLILAKEPNLTASQVEARLKDTAVPDELYRDGVNNGYRPAVTGGQVVPLLGSGVVNARAAVDPSLDQSPSILTNRVDRVQAGCGVLGQDQSGTQWILTLPVLFVFVSWYRRRFPR